MKSKILILDLDETLFYSEHKSRMNDVSFDFINESFPIFEGEYYTMFRPHLKEFLKYIFANFTIAVYTAASQDYAELLLTKMGVNLNTLEFLWARDRCTIKYDYENGFGNPVAHKKLYKVGKKYNLDNILMVDDKPHLIDCYGNVIGIKPFYGDSSDKELLRLINYLDKIKDEESYRKIDKRAWSSKIEI
ncbi:MAG: phosphoprotein phosphatase [Spirochaetes bacterium]|nr:MAG: phosphoprotein phosphatase [Spirochaetota bacterium]